MGTSRTFSAMLNEYLTNDLMVNEWMKRDYAYSKMEKDDGWKGGTMPVPFEGQAASSIEFGQLADTTDVAESLYVRGQITSMPEAWATLKFNFRDMIEHDGKVNEKSFLKLLPGQIDAMMTRFKMVVSTNILGGPHFAKVVTDAAPTDAANGIFKVDRIDRFELSQKAVIDDDNSASTTVYVIAVDVNNETVTLSLTRGGVAANLSAYTYAQNAKLYHPGVLTNAPFTSIRSQLLSLANGGAASLYGQTKLSYPFLQAVQLDGSSVTATNILDKIFDGETRRRILGKGGFNPEIVMSLKHFGSCLKALEYQKGSFNIVPGSRKVSAYGWDTIEIGSVTGQVMKLVGIQEMEDSEIMYLDWSKIKFVSNGSFRQAVQENGDKFYVQRATSGYSFFVDTCLFGDSVVTAPSTMAIMYGIPNY